MLIWPTRKETWAADALVSYLQAGGACVLYVGDGPGGRTGDPTFHAILGELGRCLACTLDVTDTPCTCNARQLGRRIAEVPLPSWQADDVRLFVYDRFVTQSASSSSARPPPTAQVGLVGVTLSAEVLRVSGGSAGRHGGHSNR